jgi:hypothetical protein
LDDLVKHTQSCVLDMRCETGLQTVNWNSMDIWVWHGRFEDCGRAVPNVMGNWHVWESLILCSRQADLSSLNLMAFWIVNNTSRKEAAPKEFEFLANVGEHPDPAPSASGAGPLEYRGSVDDPTLLRHLAPLRRARVWQPEDSVPVQATHLRLHRVMASGGHGAVVEFRGQP